MFCSNCGVENKNTSKFCMSCGSPLFHTAPAAPVEPQPVAAQPIEVPPAAPAAPVETQPVQTYTQPVQTYAQPYTQPVQTYTQPVRSEPAKPKAMSKILSLIAHLAMVAGALLLVLVLIVPVISAVPGYAEVLDSYGDMEVYNGLSGAEIKEFSPIEIIGMYLSNIRYSEEAGIVFLAIAIFFGLFALLNLLFAGLRKPIPVFIFTTLTFFVGLIQEGCYSLEELVGGRYQWGIGHSMLYIGAILAIGSGIFYMIVRPKRRRA